MNLVLSIYLFQEKIIKFDVGEPMNKQEKQDNEPIPPFYEE